MNDAQLSAVLHAMARLPDGQERRALRDLSIELTNTLNAERMATTLAEAAKVDGEGVTPADAELVDRLLGKGISANGFNPELTTAQVGRAIAVMQYAMLRVAVGTLSFDESRILEEVFDKAAEGEDAPTVQGLRLLENRVRIGLGLERRGLPTARPEHLA